MENSPIYWSVDFEGADEDSVNEIVDYAIQRGLVEFAIPCNPQAFCTLHMDRETVQALKVAIAHSQADEGTLLMVSAIQDMLNEWMAGHSE